MVCGTASAYAATDATQTGRSVTPTPRAIEDNTELKPHMGILVGATNPEGSGNTGSEIGIDVGYQPYIPYAVGAEFIHSRVENGTTTDKRNTLWVKGTYNFGGDIIILRESYVGLAAGAVMLSDKTAAAVAPLVGFDIPMQMENGKHISFGANARYAIVSEGEADTFSLNGAVKYWF
ncbi:MAG: hypothetical protein ACK41T_02005 [Pseudobdellovibrio sp.]